MTSPESTEDGREIIWTTGSENYRLIHELLDPSYVHEERASGRTTRLALKYVELCLKVAPARVIVEDHYPGVDATRNMIYIMGKLFNELNIEYEVRRVPKDGFTPRQPGEKTRKAQSGDIFEVVALLPGVQRTP